MKNIYRKINDAGNQICNIYCVESTIMRTIGKEILVDVSFGSEFIVLRSLIMVIRVVNFGQIFSLPTPQT